MNPSLRFPKFRNSVGLTVAVLVCTCLLLLSIPQGSTPTACAEACPGMESPGALEQVLENPKDYIGCEILVEGTLEAVDSGDRTYYFLKTASNRSLEVWAWAPEKGRPAGSADESAVKTMSDFVNRQLRLTGRLVEERSGSVVLEVSIAEEL